MWNSIKLNFKHFKGFLKEKYFAGLYCQDPLTNVSQGERWQNISGVMGKIQILTLKKENSEILLVKVPSFHQLKMSKFQSDAAT